MTLEQALAALAEMNRKLDAAQAELDKNRTDAKAVAEGKVTALQKTLDEAAAARDQAQAEVKRLQDAKAKEPTVDQLVTRKLAVVDSARALHAKASDVDSSKPERDIMVAALVSRDPDFKVDGKSDDYVRARFDLAVEGQKKADASHHGAMRSTAMGGTANADGTPNVEFVTDDNARAIRKFDSAVFGNQAFTMNAWKGETEATKARASVTADVMAGKSVGGEFVRPQFDGVEVMDRMVAFLRNTVSRSDLAMYSRVRDIRKDSDPATAFFQRELMHIITTPYFKVYSEIKYAQLWPVTYEVPTGARTWEAQLFDELGQADIVDDYADDAPDAEIAGSELIGKIYPVRAQFTYSLQDIRSAMLASRPIDAMKAAASRRIVERKCDVLAATGDSKRSLTGFANDANATTVTAGTKAKGGTKWITLSTGVVNATPDEMLADINLMYWAVFNATDGNIEPNTLNVGKGVWGVMNTVRLDQYNQTTVGDYLRSKLPWLKNINYWPRLNTAGSAGVERQIVAAVDPEYARAIIPQDYEILPPQVRNMSWVNPVHKRWGEPQIMQPKTLAYMDGLTA